MLKTLLAQVKEYKTASLMTPLFMIGEVICEMVIPVLMGRIVDIGIGGSNMNYIVRKTHLERRAIHSLIWKC